MALYHELGRAQSVEAMFRPGDRINYEKLKERFQKEAVVVDPQTGFIRVAFMNRPPDIDDRMLNVQADLLAWIFRFSFATRIIGIPESGLPLTREVARRFPGAKLMQSGKENGASIPFFRRDTFSVYSFTQQKNLTMFTEPIERGERYLVIDDVVAYGNAAGDFVHALESRGAEIVGLGVGFDKQFQGGLEKIAREHEFPVASLVTIKSISQDNKVILATS